MMVERIYLDYAATAPLRPQARARMVELLDVFGNASSVHAEGQMARSVLDESRRSIADMLGVRAERVVFTSGGTEANNIALRGFVQSSSGKTLLVSAVEHDCVRNTGKALGAGEIPVDGQGLVKLDWLRDALAKGGIGMVSVMFANNENGVLQPIEEIAKICKAAGVIFHTDAVQVVGHRPVAVDALGVDMLSFAAHKFGGPKGAGVLVLKSEIEMAQVVTGGSQERNRRAGTENILAIGGMATALATALENMDKERVLASDMAATFERCVQQLGLDVVGADAPKVEHVRQVVVDGIRGEDIVIGMDMRRIAVSQGSACGSGKVKESHVLRAMGYNAKRAGEAVRVSWGWDSTPQHVDAAVNALAALKTHR